MTSLGEPLPDLASLDLLVSVGQLGSINAAAAAHRVSQPAASMRLRALERKLGIQLLDRSRLGSRLTPAGQATVEWAAAVLQDVHLLFAGVAALRRTAAQLDVAASMTVAEYLMPQWLKRFASESPEVGVSLKMGNTARVTELVREGEVEVGFVEGPDRPRRVRSRDLMSDELAIAVTPSHPWARRRHPVPPEELASTPLVLRERGSGTRDVLASALAARGLEPTALMELGSTTAIKAATIAGAGPTVLSVLAMDTELTSGQLIGVACEGIRLTRTIRAIWRTRDSLSRGAETLLAIAATARGPGD